MNKSGESKVTKVELGCGATKNEGYIGIDRFPLTNVDIVTDLNDGIPLADNSVELIFSSHSLEHFENLPKLVNEIYRVCKHKAIVNILAPYHMETVNLANMYHKQVFNESTFRFYTNEENTSINLLDYYNPHASLWGLGSSDNSKNDINIVTLNIEYFYFPGYEKLSDSERRNARKSLINVCDQIYYSLAVNKSKKAFTDEEIAELKLISKAEEVPNINLIRNRNLDHQLGTTIIEDIKKWDKDVLNELKEELLNNNWDILEHLDQIEKEHKLNLLGLVNKNDSLMQQMQETINNKITYLENQNIDNNLIIEKRINNNIEIINQENARIIVDLQEQLKKANAEINSLAALTLDSIRSKEKNVSKSKLFALFSRSRDLSEVISINHTYFYDSLVLHNDMFSKRSKLCFSQTIPFEGYIEYILYGYGNKINFFLFSTIGAKIFVEIVVCGRIIKQESFTISYEGVYSLFLPENVKGEFYIRFRTLDNISICRLLDIVNRRWRLFEKKCLACFVE